MTLRPFELVIAPSPEALSQQAAGLFAEEAREAARRRGRVLVLLSGGETPRRCYELLAQKPHRAAVPWHAVQVYWGDERFVPPGDPRNNASMAAAALLEHVPLSASQIHPIPILDSPRASAASYEAALRALSPQLPPRFDLALLGLGADGHTASLFPGSNVLGETNRWVREVELDRESRVTVTAPVLNAATMVVFLVSGAEKAQVLAEVLEGGEEAERLPARQIRPAKGRVIWLVDREAARLLRRREGEH